MSGVMSCDTERKEHDEWVIYSLLVTLHHLTSGEDVILRPGIGSSSEGHSLLEDLALDMMGCKLLLVCKSALTGCG